MLEKLSGHDHALAQDFHLLKVEEYLNEVLGALLAKATHGRESASENSQTQENNTLP